MKSWRRRAIVVRGRRSLIFFLATLPALAAEAAEQDPADSTTGLIFRWLNFVLVFGGIGYLIAKHGGAFFRANAKAIAASITEAQAAKAEADRELREVEAKIARLDQEVAELRESARRDSAGRSRTVARFGTGRDSKRSIMAARGELGASERAAQQELRALAASDGGGARRSACEFPDERGSSRKNIPLVPG